MHKKEVTLHQENDSIFLGNIPEEILIRII